MNTLGTIHHQWKNFSAREHCFLPCRQVSYRSCRHTHPFVLTNSGLVGCQLSFPQSYFIQVTSCSQNFAFYPDRQPHILMKFEHSAMHNLFTCAKKHIFSQTPCTFLDPHKPRQHTSVSHKTHLKTAQSFPQPTITNLSTPIMHIQHILGSFSIYYCATRLHFVATRNVATLQL